MTRPILGPCACRFEYTGEPGPAKQVFWCAAHARLATALGQGATIAPSAGYPPLGEAETRATGLLREFQELGVADPDTLLDFVLREGLPMKRDGQFRYHGVVSPVWHATPRQAIQAAMLEFSGALPPGVS